MLTSKEEKHLELLRKAVWQKATNKKNINLGHSNFETIRKAILVTTGYSLSRDTIKNFYTKNHQPAPQTLDIYSTYVLGGNQDHPQTYIAFIASFTPTAEQKAIPNNRKKRLPGIIGFILFACFLLVVFLHCYNDTTEDLTPIQGDSFRDEFTNSNLEELNQRGWFLFPDSINTTLWDNPEYRNNGYLTLETRLGDSYLTSEEYEPKVINILAKEIDCKTCCEIQVKLVDFNPFQRYQQAGFFIFYDTITYPSIRYSFAHDGIVQAVTRNGKYSSHKPFGVTARNRIYTIDNETVLNPIDSIILQLRIENSEYIFSQKADDGPFIDIKGIKRHLPFPAYIGLYACQGRPEIPHPIWPVADIIPANFGYAQVRPCKEVD